MSRSVPQTSYKAESGASYDKCWTPWHGVAPLLPYLPPKSRIWEPCAGAGWLACWLREAGHEVIATDYDPPRDAIGVDPTPRDALKWAPDPGSYDRIITNPPWSLKVDLMDALYTHGKPVGLLVPAVTSGLASAIKVRKAHGRTWEELRLNKRINYHMPGSGFVNNGAQLPSMWLCSGLLPAAIVEGLVPDPRPEHRLQKPPKRLKVGRDDVRAWFLDRVDRLGLTVDGQQLEELIDLAWELHSGAVQPAKIEQATMF